MRFVGDKGSFVKHTFNKERDFEKKIYKYSDDLFRASKFVRWTPLLRDRMFDEGVRPDSLMLSLDHNEWWVVEVELARKEKLSDMQDQIGKLSRVNYNLHQHDIRIGLKKMDLDVDIDELSKKLASIQPRFLLVIDRIDEEFTKVAKYFGFQTLVIEPFSTIQGNIRFMMPQEHISTLEPIFTTEKSIILKPPMQDEKPPIINGMWHYHVPSGFFSSELVKIADSEEIFESKVIHMKGIDVIRLPVDLRSIRSIVKGNKIGKLSCSGDDDELFILTTQWNRL
ncbi:hypothetical protein N9M84_03285 [Candidatus Poseidoniales archaeon]|nr:hypothetical protein [Candidatus Poseidoniales archaeon]